MANRILTFVLVLISIGFVSCITKKNLNSQWCQLHERDYSFNCEADALVFTYHSKLRYRADTMVTFPIPFSVCLPENLQRFQFVNSEEFVFYYPENQAIYLKIDIHSRLKISDTAYLPSKVQIESVFSEADNELVQFKELYHSRFRNRICRVMVKDNLTFFLYNVKRNNIDFYISCVSKEKINP